MKISVLIMAGGIGERLWPLSREEKPKQFLTIYDNKSLIEQTIDRAKQITSLENIFIITGNRYKSTFKKYMPDFQNIIYEPIGRDTTAAIALGVYYIKEKVGDSIVVIVPADPIIKENKLFIDSIKEAIERTKETKNISIIGIKPTRAETGYGYIKLKDIIKYNSYNVDRFVEKPNLEKAKEYLKDSNYLWNSGMFIWDTDSILKKIKTLANDTYNKVVETYKNINDENKALEIFSTIEKKSFDFSIMEKLNDIICIKSNFFWDDLGAFSALYRIYEKDENQNVTIGDVFVKDSNNNIIISDDDTFMAISGVENLTIVKSKDVLLIYSNNEDNRIKDILKDIKEKEELKDKRKYI